MIEVKYTYYDDWSKVLPVLESLGDIVACDFEVANVLTDKERNIKYARIKSGNFSDKYKRKLQQQLDATGLFHPSLASITHFSIADSINEAIVIICTNSVIRSELFKWLVTTDKVQIWHNLGFDGKHILYHTGKLPQQWEDTQLLARCLLNDANDFHSQTGLKGFMADQYDPRWKELADDFSNPNYYDEDFLMYAAIDACATYNLYFIIINSLKEKENDESA